jgi:GxxExxY protein
VIGSAIEVHRSLGPGFQESVYQRALAIELAISRIPFREQHRLQVEFKGRFVGEGFVDFYVDQRLIVEIKSVDTLHPVHTAQVVSYLRANRSHLGLLINFNTEILRKGLRRVVVS